MKKEEVEKLNEIKKELPELCKSVRKLSNDLEYVGKFLQVIRGTKNDELMALVLELNHTPHKLPEYQLNDLANRVSLHHELINDVSKKLSELNSVMGVLAEDFEYYNHEVMVYDSLVKRFSALAIINSLSEKGKEIKEKGTDE